MLQPREKISQPLGWRLQWGPVVCVGGHLESCHVRENCSQKASRLEGVCVCGGGGEAIVNNFILEPK